MLYYMYILMRKFVSMYVFLDGFNNFKRDVNVRGIVLFYD